MFHPSFPINTNRLGKARLSNKLIWSRHLQQAAKRREKCSPKRMDPNTRAELDSLKREQESLEKRLERVGMALIHEESRVRAAATNLENLQHEQSLLQKDSR